MVKRISLASVFLFGMGLGFLGDLWGVPPSLAGIGLAICFGLWTGLRLWRDKPKTSSD